MITKDFIVGFIIASYDSQQQLEMCISLVKKFDNIL